MFSLSSKLPRYFKNFFNKEEYDFLKKNPSLAKGVELLKQEKLEKRLQHIKMIIPKIKKAGASADYLKEKPIGPKADCRLIEELKVVQSTISDDIDFRDIGLTEENFQSIVSKIKDLALEFAIKQADSKEEKNFIKLAEENNLISLEENEGIDNDFISLLAASPNRRTSNHYNFDDDVPKTSFAFYLER